ncbi:MAG: hypothetical protein A2X86_08670 [Bdellovibrionales bacterium GWA2_49_15]|nr:MAG: hypothetical protein A2X86_08670 [Bdellovibrionales bacterium GWA2_49_15]HAZ11163.1 hypothetical protein [Bdellovibrionales bacterium]
MSAELPNFKNQGAWTSGDKKAFIDYLESGKQAPISGNVQTPQQSVEPRSEDAINFDFGKAMYVNFSVLTNSMYTVGSDNVRHSVSNNLGAKILVGGHIFSWVRSYFGMQYSGMDQKMKNGQKARLNHYEFPAGFELALIPLGTPHTRYVLLRGGVAAHYIEGNRRDADFDTTLLGLRGTWNGGLGYEWQIAETNVRVNLLLEGFKSMSKENGSKYIGAGLTSGVAYTF